MAVQDAFTSVGRQTWRKDGVAKVTGAEKYAGDVAVPRMWYGRVLRSLHAHARIKHVDTNGAEALGAVCFTLDDIPSVKYNERIVSTPSHLYRDRYVLADKARHIGEPIAAVAAPTEELAERALRAIRVEYELLPVLLTAEEAMTPGSEPIHDTVLLEDNEIPIHNNVAVSRSVEVGDVEQGWSEADFAIEREYSTSPIYHAQMETKSVVCEPLPDGGVNIWATTQSIHNIRLLMGEIYGIPLSKINVHKVGLGGSFGSSIQVNSIVPVCVGLALKSGRPIKIVSTREEDVYDHLRYPSSIRLKLGFKSDGSLVAGDMRATIEIGAHNTQAYPFLGVLAGFWASLYALPNLKYEGIAVYTNRTISCAMQGFGGPQVHFAVESLMDEAATELGIDPVDLKMKNYIGLGGTFWGHGPNVKTIIQSDGVPELMEKGRQWIGWNERPKTGSQTSRYRRGIGMARGFHTSGVGHPQATKSEMIDYSGAIVKVNQDGTIDVVQSLMDHGGGTNDAIAKIVAEELGIPVESVGLSQVDTHTSVYDIATHATRGVYAGGTPAHKAAKEVRAKLLEYAGRVLDVLPESLAVEADQESGQGVIYCQNIPDRRITVGELARYCHVNSWGSIAAVASSRQVNAPPAYIVYFVEVEVDTETGHVKTLRASIGADCGTVVNPDLAVGQIVGALGRGAGYTLIEDTQFDPETGEIASGGFLVDAKTPSVSESLQEENLNVDFADTYEPTGPFGAKGLGEAPANPVASAYTNAICNAIGVRFYHLPITPENVVRALQKLEQEPFHREPSKPAVVPAAPVEEAAKR